MIHNGYPRGTLHPFRGSNQSDATVSAPHFGAPAGQSRPLGEMNTLATLSVVFAFVFAPIGVVWATWRCRRSSIWPSGAATVRWWA